TLIYTQPGKPTQNAYIERFNRTVREELLSNYLFETINEVQIYSTKWLWISNNERPHSAIGSVPPCQL
ncbi:MAG TPA: transposase, partial [Candidatus Dorea intestinavium]|nr:transposase [Candidatus Dorea intestinavium]